MAIEENKYALEGLDATGKTTTIELLQKRGYVVFKTPPERFPIPRGEYNNLEVEQRFLYYLFGVMMAAKDAQKVAIGQKVVFDRYLLSTIAGNRALGLPERFITSAVPLLKEVAIPEYTFLLVADEPTRIQRLMERGANENDMASLKISSKILEGYKKWSKELGHPMIEVDTTILPPRQVVEFIEDIIYSR